MVAEQLDNFIPRFFDHLLFNMASIEWTRWLKIGKEIWLYVDAF